MPKHHLAERGFLTFAVGKEYLRLARAQAMSIKLTQPKVKNFAVIVDKDASQHILDDDAGMFDKIIVLDHNQSGWDMTQEWMAAQLSPWQETFKTDADMVFTSSVDHWWDSLRYRDVCLCSSVRDFRGDVIQSRAHRKLFDENLLPDVYSAMTYFRYSRGAHQFFDMVRRITQDWEWFSKELLIKNSDPTPRTDEIYALAARQLGAEDLMLPTDVLPTFVHMREELNGMGLSRPWHEQIYSYWKRDKLFVGNIVQTLPFHYHEKGWMNDERYNSIRRDYQEFHGSH